MIISRSLRHAAAAALLMTVFAAPAASSASPVPAPSQRWAMPADVIDPPMPVQAFPGQVEEACGIWKGLSWPQAARPTDYAVKGTRLVIRGSNVYGNRSGDLPAGGHYREYDVNPRKPGQHRDAERIIRDSDTHTVWFTGDHYTNFQEISSGCE